MTLLSNLRTLAANTYRALPSITTSLPALSERLDYHFVNQALRNVAADSYTNTQPSVPIGPIEHLAMRGIQALDRHVPASIGLARLSANLERLVSESRDSIQNFGSNLLQGRFSGLLPDHRQVLPQMLFHDAHLMTARFPRTNHINFQREIMLQEAVSLYPWQAVAWLSALHGSTGSMFQDFNKNIHPYQTAIRSLIRQSPKDRVKALQRPGSRIKLSKSDNPKQSILGHRLFNNKSTYMNLAKELGGDTPTEKFIVETLAQEIDHDMTLGISADQYLEHPVTNMEYGAKRLAKETLADLKKEEHQAALKIQNAYREYRALNPNVPGRWRPEFDRPDPATDSPIPQSDF